MMPGIHVRIRVERLNDRGDLSRFERMTILRAQISLLRRRCENGLPVTLHSLLNAEHVARSLELEEVIQP
jgi:hypothetical protein